MRTREVLFFSGLAVFFIFVACAFCTAVSIFASGSSDSGNVGDKLFYFFQQPFWLLIPETALLIFFVLSVLLPKTKEWAKEELYKFSSFLLGENS